LDKGYRHRYSVIEYLLVYALSYRAIGRLVVNMFRKDLNPHFVERLMLAVTEVNGCEICSYAHASMALKQGLNQEEIKALLDGDKSIIRPEEAVAIYFAQHYADMNGFPNRDAYETLHKSYSKRQTKTIVAAIQMMMLGNVSGLPFSALLSRFRKKPYHNSNLFYELIMNLSTILLFVPSIVLSEIFIIIFPKNILFQNKKYYKNNIV